MSMKTNNFYTEDTYLLRAGAYYFYNMKEDKKPQYTMNPSNAMRFKSEADAKIFAERFEDRTPFTFYPAFQSIHLVD